MYPRTNKREYEVGFMKQFQKYLLNEEYDADELHHIIVAVDQQDLEKWVTVITKKRIDQETKKKNDAGWFGFFRQKHVEEELKENEDLNISPEEIEEVYKTLHDKFLKDDDIEEVKDASDIKNIEAELVVQKGGLNLIYKDVSMNLYFHDSSLKFNQFTDEKMSIGAQTRDFGLDMDSDQHFEVIEKMDESEVFWEMAYLKNEPGHEIEHSLNLTINPIKIVYEGAFIKSIVKFFRNESDLQIKEQAAEKWADFKEGAQTQLQESIKAGRKDINIIVYSPILLIPLQFNDPNSKVWAVNLGDFALASEKSKGTYELYNFGISSVMIKFYENYELWEK